MLVTNRITGVTTKYVRSFLEEEAYLPTAHREALEITDKKITAGRTLLAYVTGMEGGKGWRNQGIRYIAGGIVCALAGGMSLLLKSRRPPRSGDANGSQVESAPAGLQMDAGDDPT
jgi:hypothetical protein